MSVRPLFAALVLAVGFAHAGEAPAPGFLKSPALTGFTLPAPPAEGSEIARIDLAEVRANHPAPQSPAWQDAIADARAYLAPDIISRFNDVTERDLRAAERPQLMKLLTRMRPEMEKISSDNKALYKRNRPYAQHSDVTPCSTDYLVKDQSYPSGHSFVGYTTALVLADVFPERADAILARGVRYSNNRVVCGVHYPSDVAQGRFIAAAYIAAARQNPAFAAGLDCAKREDAVIAKKEATLPVACSK